jgi:hypothetical protein
MDPVRDSAVSLAFSIGESAALSRTFARADVDEYFALAGTAARHDGEVPPAMVGALISCLLGTQLPGLGTNWLKQRLAFTRHARIGEPLTASVEITRLRHDKGLIDLRTRCFDSAGRPICDGAALVLLVEQP